MQTLNAHQFYSVREYLDFEESVLSKHEYVAGLIYPRPSESVLHNRIATNFVFSLCDHVRGNDFWAHSSATRLRIRTGGSTRFYYADGCIVSRPNPPHDIYQDEAVIIAEVLSKRTRRIDEGKKKDAYLTIPSLGVYLLIEHDQALVTVHRRTDQGFVREVYAGLDAVISLKEINTELPLSEIYAGVELTPEPGDEEDR